MSVIQRPQPLAFRAFLLSKLPFLRWTWSELAFRVLGLGDFTIRIGCWSFYSTVIVGNLKEECVSFFRPLHYPLITDKMLDATKAVSHCLVCF